MWSSQQLEPRAKLAAQADGEAGGSVLQTLLGAGMELVGARLLSTFSYKPPC